MRNPLAVIALCHAALASAQVTQLERIKFLPMAQCDVQRAHAALFLEPY